MTKAEELETKILKIVDDYGRLRRENHQLKAEVDSLKAHLGLLSGENSKAQRILTEYEQLRRKQELVTQRVERALSTLNSLRSAS